MKKYNIFREFRYVIIAATLLLLSCSKSTANRIEKTGDHLSPSHQKSVLVDIDHTGLVTYSVKESKTGVILASESIGSTYQKWFFYWESDSKLWIKSSDLGMLKVLEFSVNNNVIKNKKLKRGDAEISSMPVIVKNGLSKSIASRLGL